MTQDEIIEMVNQVGCKSYSPPPTRSVAGVSMTFAQVEALIKLVAEAEAEREACAKVCESLPMQQEIDVRDQCAAAIRARGQA
jgi:hypothetical protein